MKTKKSALKVKYGWVMYRANSSSSSGDWIYKEITLPLDKEQRDILRGEIDEMHNYSDHYRGCNIKIIKSPPRSYLNELAESCNDKITILREKEKRYLNLARKAPAKIKFYYTDDSPSGPWVIESMNFPKHGGKKPWGYNWKSIVAYDMEEARLLIKQQKESKNAKTKASSSN